MRCRKQDFTIFHSETQDPSFVNLMKDVSREGRGKLWITTWTEAMIMTIFFRSTFTIHAQALIVMKFTEAMDVHSQVFEEL